MHVCPCRAITNACAFFVVETFEPLETHISQKQTKPIYLTEKTVFKTKLQPLTGRHGLIEHMYQRLRSICQKRRGHWTFKDFGAMSFNQPVERNGWPVILLGAMSVYFRLVFVPYTKYV